MPRKDMKKQGIKVVKPKSGGYKKAKPKPKGKK
jgi:hypothetical protein